MRRVETKRRGNRAGGLPLQWMERRACVSGCLTENTSRARPLAGGAAVPIVGVGASAGGLDELRRLLGAGFVIAEHLAPDHPTGRSYERWRNSTQFVSKVRVCGARLAGASGPSRSYRSGAVRDAGLVIVSVGGRALRVLLYQGFRGGDDSELTRVLKKWPLASRSRWVSKFCEGARPSPRAFSVLRFS